MHLNTVLLVLTGFVLYAQSLLWLVDYLERI
jgi:hypothetical protein